MLAVARGTVIEVLRLNSDGGAKAAAKLAADIETLKIIQKAQSKEVAVGKGGMSVTLVTQGSM